MDLVFHLGLHSTDGELIVETLLRNAEPLGKAGILIPEPPKYRPLLRDTVMQMRGGLADADMQDALLDTILEDAEGHRAVMSNENFICIAANIFGGRTFYDKMAVKANWLRNLFPDFDVTFALGLRDIATLIPALYARSGGTQDFSDWLAEIDTTTLSWFRVIDDLRSAVPDARLLIWCNEDTPLIWPEVLRALAGVPEDMPLEGEDALLATIMSKPGLERMRSYLAEHPPRSIDQRRRIVTAFLDKFALDEAVEEDVDLPGWTEEVMDAFSLRYEADTLAISRLPDVDFIQP